MPTLLPRARAQPRLFLALLLGLLPARAGLAGEPVSVYDPARDEAAANIICARMAHAEPPASDRPTTAQRQALVGCDGEALLYGIGRPADPAKARLCAFVQRAHPAMKGEPSGLFDGNGLLMTIYANGLGVPRNKAVATHLACDGVFAAPIAREDRVLHLAGARHAPFYKAIFSPCDDVTSGAQQGACAEHALRIRNAEQASTLDHYAASLPAQARTRFAALRLAQANWAHARAEGEIDQSGTARGALVADEEALQNADFLDMVKRLRTGHPPHTGASKLREAQARIDKVLPHLLAITASNSGGEITSSGIGKAQAAWIAYRDAWGAFAKIAYPQWGADGAEAWVAMKRADMLSHMAPS